METYVVNASWDDEAKVWIAASDDVPGLCCEAVTLPELRDAVTALAPGLLLLNGRDVPAEGVPLDLAIETDETGYLLSNPAMNERLLAAMNSAERMSWEEVNNALMLI
jgi:hypothetical protein